MERKNQVDPPDSESTIESEIDINEAWGQFISELSEDDIRFYRQRSYIDVGNDMPIQSVESANRVFHDYYSQMLEHMTISKLGLMEVRVSGVYFYAGIKGEAAFILVKRGDTRVFHGYLAPH